MKINNIFRLRSGQAFKLIIAIVVSEMAGIIGSVFTTPSIAGWYAGIVKPAYNPPAWVFGPVWTILFVLMGVAAFLVWKKGLDRRDVKIALGIFVGQLVLNTLWSIIFFGLHNPGAAFVEIIFLWLAIFAVIIAFAKITRLAAWFLVPYILWTSFAAYLNYSIWQLNSLTALATDGVSRYFIVQEGKLAEKMPPENNWLAFADSALGLSFKYPSNLSGQYISPASWPPVVTVKNGEFVCETTPSESSLPDRIFKRQVDDRWYCVTARSGAAAGSVYTDYVYSSQIGDKLVSLAFTLRYPQCLNYDEPRQSACQSEREAFDLDGVVDRIIRTVTWRD